jgi:hypothetical protein
VEGTIVIDEVVSDRVAWIVIHEDADGTPGEIIGRTQVPEGISRQISVGINAQAATESLYAVLYEDAGELSQFEIHTVDKPVLFNGKMITASFQQLLDIE